MGLTPARARASIRFSLSKLTTEEEVDQAIKLVPAAVAHLRELSPTYTKPEAVTSA
jgi:cysteine desulfurase